MLLAQGSVVYYGAANKAVDYFDSIGYPCSKFSNPTDFFSKLYSTYQNILMVVTIVKLIHIEQSSKASYDRVQLLVESYKKSELCEQNQSVQPTYVELEKKKTKVRKFLGNFC